MLLLVFCLVSTITIRRLARKHDLQNYYCYAGILQISLLAYATSGAFLEFGSFDLYYQIIALVIVLRTLFDKEVELARKQTSTTDKHASAVQSARHGTKGQAENTVRTSLTDS